MESLVTLMDKVMKNLVEQEVPVTGVEDHTVVQFGEAEAPMEHQVLEVLELMPALTTKVQMVKMA